MAKKPRNVHDRAFKALFSAPEAALPILRASLPPALMDAIDPGSLTPEPTNFVNDELAEDSRDLLFSARIRGRYALFYVIEHLCDASHKCSYAVPLVTRSGSAPFPESHARAQDAPQRRVAPVA